MELLINLKQDKLNEYKDAINSEASLKLELLHKENQLRLTEDFSEKIGKKKPTVKEIDAYIQEKLKTLVDEYELSKKNTELIKKDLELINDKIKVEEYKIQSRIQGI